jgi:anti-sigma regulatory factor (Ser/Thr protein kinase)
VERVPAAPGGEVDHGFLLRLPSQVHLVDTAVDLLTSACFDGGDASPRTRFRLRTVLAEALANAIECGNGGDPAKTVEVRIDLCRDDRLRLTVTDEGRGFDPTRTPDPIHPETVTAPCGRGLFIIRSLAIHVGFNEKGNTIWMILPRS